MTLCLCRSLSCLPKPRPSRRVSKSWVSTTNLVIFLTFILYIKNFFLFLLKIASSKLDGRGNRIRTDDLSPCGERSNQLSYSSGYRNCFCYSCFVFYVVKYSKLFCSCKPLKNNFFIGQPLKKNIQSISSQNYHIILDCYDMLLQIRISSD